MEIRYKSLADSTYVPLWRPFFNQDKGSRAKLSTHKPNMLSSLMGVQLFEDY